MYIYLLISIIIILIIDSIIKFNLYKREDKLEKRIVEKRKEKLETEFSALESEMQKKTQKLNADFDALSARVATARTEADDSVRGYEAMKEAQDRAGAEYVQIARQKNEEEIHRSFDANVSEYRSDIYATLSQIRQDAQKELGDFLSANDEIIELKKKEIEDLDKVIKDFKEKRNAINSEIMRQRKIEEEQNFYRICLSENAKEDINYLISIVNNFHNKEIIYKLIWSEYIQGPFKEMLNRVLEGKEIKNVIYMIKNIKTGEIYIGKTSALVSKRWTEHIKTSLNIGTISRTKVHKALFNNWDDFSFSIIEEVSEDIKLGEREKYYINFYNSDTYGYNIKSGG